MKFPVDLVADLDALPDDFSGSITIHRKEKSFRVKREEWTHYQLDEPDAGASLPVDKPTKGR